jgi:pimeloyl-ACP methyl ester carboxylesterase
VRHTPSLRWLRQTLAPTFAIIATISVAVVAHEVSVAASAPNPDGPKPTVVLVHGAWADSSSWDGVVRRLQNDGYPVDVFPTPLRGLTSDSAVLAAYLQTIPGPVVLVGHSFGGAVITDAATGDPNVKALVYVDAFAPAAGESIAQLANATPGSCLAGGGDPTKVFNIVPNPTLQAGDADLYAKAAADSPYPGFAACFANDISASRAAVLATTQRPLTLSSLVQGSGTPAWKTIPSWYLVGTLDNAIPPAEQMAMAQRAGADIVEVAASHLSMISRPAAVTNLIIEAATSHA